MTASELIEVLKGHDPESRVVLGRVSELGGGLGAYMDNTNVFVTGIAKTVVLHTNDPKKPLDHGDGYQTITNFE